MLFAVHVVETAPDEGYAHEQDRYHERSRVHELEALVLGQVEQGLADRVDAGREVAADAQHHELHEPAHAARANPAMQREQHGRRQRRDDQASFVTTKDVRDDVAGEHVQ